ncbi:hypothetical protein [Nocardiopsis metallicus]|uniref:Uncharacterized protein n=1 Tax=Nocardiopsis metallicus TaxID=179819 RepID=A0A840WRJ3_9ACTN|nr:hypothetical protein [Nocardiopsis metallicus]MBB5494515.1 hypothetical protein [Nocardiopsis metallicus]
MQDTVETAGFGEGSGNIAVAALFAVSALVAITCQVRLTDWAKRRWDAAQALPRGLAVMAVAFLPVLATPPLADALRDMTEAPPLAAALVVAPALLTAALLGLGGALVYPFEMDTVVRLSGDRLVATHYGLYNTVSGILASELTPWGIITVGAAERRPNRNSDGPLVPIQARLL